jgi:hypothetical protein
MTLDNSDSEVPDQPERPGHNDPTWVRAISAVVANWSTTLRVGLLIVLVTGVIVAIGLLSLNVAVGPIKVGSR